MRRIYLQVFDIEDRAISKQPIGSFDFFGGGQAKEDGEGGGVLAWLFCWGRA